MKYLTLKGNLWQVKIDVPADCQAELGKRNWVETTGTGDTAKAKVRRDEIERQVKDVFNAIRAGTYQQGTAADLGASLRQSWLNSENTAEEGRFSEKDLVAQLAEDQADRMRPSQRKAFEAAWTGQVDANKYVEAWLKEARLAPRTAKEWTGLTGRFQKWTEANDVKLTGIDRKVAGRYVVEELAPMHPATAAKYVSCLRGYWAYLIRRGHVDRDIGNVWADQLQPQRAKGGDRDAMEEERALTVAEVKKLTDDKASKGLAELSLVATLSGMRLGEILALTKEALVTIDGIECFDLRKSKTRAGVRVVPVHSGLSEVVEGRTKGEGSFWPEFAELTNESVSKRFATYRRKHGIDETIEGRRRALTNFHSLRKTFVTLARQAGMNEATIGQVEQEGKKSLTFSVYSKASTKQLQEVVESVKL